MVQFNLLHSKFPLCTSATRGLLLSTYVKFINLFPEIKPQIQEVSASCHGRMLGKGWTARRWGRKVSRAGRWVGRKGEWGRKEGGWWDGKVSGARRWVVGQEGQ